MHLRQLISAAVTLSALTSRAMLAAQTQEKSVPGAASDQLQAIEEFANLPLYFEAQSRADRRAG